MSDFRPVKVLMLACLGLLLSACGPSRYPPIRDVYRPASPVTQGVYTVQPGDTLYSIAWRYNRDDTELAAANGIRPPYRIYPGQRIYLNKTAPAGKPPVPSRSDRPTTIQTSRYKKTETHAKAIQEKVANQRHNKVDIVWRWPAKGPVIDTFSLTGKINKGINLAGKKGEPVYAAADGRVVYSGTGLVGYGNLIIIKHNDHFLSAYGYNSRLLVKEGDIAKAGQEIAEIGSTGTNRDELHFEIRRNGKPVNPLEYLPKR